MCLHAVRDRDASTITSFLFLKRIQRRKIRAESDDRGDEERAILASSVVFSAISSSIVQRVIRQIDIRRPKCQRRKLDCPRLTQRQLREFAWPFSPRASLRDHNSLLYTSYLSSLSARSSQRPRCRCEREISPVAYHPTTVTGDN